MQPTQTRFISIQEVVKKTRLGRSTIYAKVSSESDDFPKPVKLSERASAWVEEEVEAWCQKRISESRRTSNEKFEGCK